MESIINIAAGIITIGGPVFGFVYWFFFKKHKLICRINMHGFKVSFPECPDAQRASIFSRELFLAAYDKIPLRNELERLSTRLYSLTSYRTQFEGVVENKGSNLIKNVKIILTSSADILVSHAGKETFYDGSKQIVLGDLHAGEKIEFWGYCVFRFSEKDITISHENGRAKLTVTKLFFR